MPMNAIENSFPKLVQILKKDISDNDAKVLQPFVRKLDGLVEDYEMKVMEELHKAQESFDVKIDDSPASTLIASSIADRPVSELSGAAIIAYGLILLRDRLLNEYELIKGMQNLIPNV